MEYVEHFIREHGVYNPKTGIKSSGAYAKIEMQGMSAKGEGPKHAYFHFIVKPVLGH